MLVVGNEYTSKGALESQNDRVNACVTLCVMINVLLLLSFYPNIPIFLMNVTKYLVSMLHFTVIKYK